ncbi:MAG: hypothetical protein VYE77_12255, partial [Planctomycetota bacterium]|nr:hypothetical protein [Planctomycetota bacterium]
APLLIELMQKRGAPKSEVEQLARDWISGRPNLLEPRLALARIQMEQDQPTAAIATAQQILRQNPENDQALRMIADAASLAYGPSNQDGHGLLLQCLQRGELLPDVPNPICTLLCGEAAIEQNHPDIARECARAATDVFPWARWPRHLEARAELLANRPDDALQVLFRAINTDPRDETALRLWFQASVRTNQPLNQFLSLMVRSGMQNNEIATALMRMAIEHNSPMTTAFANAAANRETSNGELLGLAAQALAAADLRAKAALVLDKAHTKLLEERQANPAVANERATQSIATGAVRLLESLSKVTPDEELVTLAKWHLRRLRPSGMITGRALLDAAEQLQTVGHAKTGYYLTQLALALGDAIEIRDGKSFYLAGKLAQQLGNPELAAAHWTAALTFEDGKVAAEPLARLELEKGNLRRAIEAAQLAGQLTDPALALLAGQAGLASKLASDSTQEDPTRLLPVVTQALVSQAAPEAIGAELHSAEPATRRSLLELLTLLEGGVSPHAALLRAQSLAAVLPDSLAVRLLLARAFADSGKGAEAAKIHASCLTGSSRPLPLFGEIIRCSTVPGYQVSPLVRGAFLNQVAQGLARVPATIAAFAIRQLASEAAAKGNLEQASKLLGDLWQRYPIIGGVTVADIARLFENKQTHQALAILGQLAMRGDAAQKKASRTTLFHFGLTRPDLFNEQNLEGMTTTALELLRTRELIGPPLAFLFADEARVANIDKPEMRELFQELLSQCAIDEEPWESAKATLQALQEQKWFHPVTLLEIFDEAVQAHPEFAPLWIERARILVSLRQTEEGLRDARSILELVDSPEVQLEFLGMAAEARQLTAKDYRTANSIPEELIATPRGQYVFGLLAMRQSKLEQAEQMLAQAEPQPSGFHIYARALTNLQRSKANSRARAHELFSQLLELYPNSSWARYAGSFVRQLASN